MKVNGILSINFNRLWIRPQESIFRLLKEDIEKNFKHAMAVSFSEDMVLSGSLEIMNLQLSENCIVYVHSV